MAENENTVEPETVFALKPKSDDVGWAFANFAVENNKDKVQCKFCKKVFSGGIYRIKCHIGQIKGNVASCREAPDEAKKICRDSVLQSSKKKKENHAEKVEKRENVNIPHEEDGDDCMMVGSSKRKKLGPMDDFVSKIEVDAELPTRKTRQQTIKDHFAKERWYCVARLLSQWVYESGIPFNTISLESFDKFCEGLGKYGPGWFPPSQYYLREPLLKEAQETTEQSLVRYQDEWHKTGCSIMTDAWTDRKRRSIMNTCIHCRLGTMFFSSDETGLNSHTGFYISREVEQVVYALSDMVVQVVTDNAKNNMAAANLLKVKFPNVFWTSCAAHTINLMLVGIADLKKFREIITRAQALVIFIYAHHFTLTMMRSFTKKRDIVRPGKTRFASAFLSLQSLLEKKEKLRLMFTSDGWVDHKLSRCSRGKTSTETVLSTQFWNGVQSCLSVFTPLVEVLRIVDGDEPTMGFVYGEFQLAIKKIKSLFKDTTQIMNVIEEKKRDKDYGRERLGSSLHLAGYFLNLYYFYKDSGIEKDSKIADAILDCIEKFFPGNDEKQSIIANEELLVYKNKQGAFGKTMAVKGCELFNDRYDPVGWWSTYGNATPNLQGMAQKILALTSSSSGCERNWSTFEGIHTKKRNRLDTERLEKLVYVQFNAKLLNRKKKRKENKEDSMLGEDSRFAQGWFVKGGDDNEIDPITGEVIGETSDPENISVPRELDVDDFVSEDESEDDGRMQMDDNEFDDDE